MSEEKEFITEWANPNLGLTARITKLLHEEQSPFSISRWQRGYSMDACSFWTVYSRLR